MNELLTPFALVVVLALCAFSVLALVLWALDGP